MKKRCILLKLVCDSKHAPSSIPLPEADLFIRQGRHWVAALQLKLGFFLEEPPLSASRRMPLVTIASCHRVNLES